MRWLIAFIITVVIYILLIWTYFINFKDIRPIFNKKIGENRIKINIREFSIPKSNIKSKLDLKSKPKQLVSKNKLKENHKKVYKKSHRKIHKKIKKSSKKRIIKRKVKKIVKNRRKIRKIRKKIKPIAKKNNFISKSEMVYISEPLFNINTTRHKSSSQMKSKKIYPNSKIARLYGKEFLSYTPKQKRFIEKNLNKIHEITQRVLWHRGYPNRAISARTGQQGTNIVSFYLHPNGDISNLRLKKRIGYSALDENTIETIKSAYKDYPYPSQITKIVFFVEYSIFGY